ncbi:hypothetical protein O4215_20730 [Rhodococcus maanshanensis]|uniref:Gp37-like protein n=1 Tax=Rhodococcus maanshanensis TaxID=183556 RepID=UPI0022B3D29E|nr:hypothetical protein [Rhodococcus maanshanensis]MCZ4557991.1 hypothetical protein [Rhodococcus maanshanensis]
MKPNVRRPPAYRILVFNQNGTAARPLGPYIKARFGWFWQVPGTGTIQVKADHPLAARLMQCKRDVVPIRAYYNGTEWEGRVMHAEIEGEPGNEIVTATCIGNLFWLATILGWVNPLFPPSVQVGLTGKQDVMFGPLDFVFKYFLARNAIRQQKPIHMALPIRYDIPEPPDLDDFASIDAVIRYITGLGDDLVILSSRFTRLDELFAQTLNSTEIGMSMKMHIPALDGPSPQVFNVDTLGRLQNILNLSRDNFLWFTNPNNILGLADPSTWNKVTAPGFIFDTHKKRDRTHMIWRTSNGQIKWYKRGVDHPTATSAIVGGKAPEFLNDLVEWGANLAIKAILNAIAPGLNLGEILIGDLLDDIFFAYQRFNDLELRDDLGPWGFGEVFADNSGAWTLDAFAVGFEALKAAGPQESLKLQVQSGGPDGRGFSFGADDGSGTRFLVGDIMTFWDRGTMIQDYVSGVEVEDSRGEFCTEYITIGDDKAIKDGWAQLVDRIKVLSSLSRAAANSTN